MKLRFKEDPAEWRKSILLTILGLAVISTLLAWRRPMLRQDWPALVVTLGVVAVIAWWRPRWFRGWYRLSLRLGFYTSQFAGRCVLALFFIGILTPLAFVLRLAGKDPLQLRPRRDGQTCWQPARKAGSLDRLF